MHAPLGQTGIDATVRAATRRATSIQMELRQGIPTLAALATVAPLLGCLATVDAIVGCFTAFAGEKSAIFAVVMNRLSNATAFAPIGLIVGVICSWCHRHLEFELDELQLDMNTQLIDLSTTLRRRTM